MRRSPKTSSWGKVLNSDHAYYKIWKENIPILNEAS